MNDDIQREDDFFEALAKSEVSKPKSLAEQKKEDLSEELEYKRELENEVSPDTDKEDIIDDDFEKEMVDNQPKEKIKENISEENVHVEKNEEFVEKVPEIIEETKSEEQPIVETVTKKETKPKKKIEILDSEQFEKEQAKKDKESKPKNIGKSENIIVDDLDQRIYSENKEIANQNILTSTSSDEELTTDKINEIIENAYDDDSDEKTINISIVNDNDSSTKKPEVKKEQSKSVKKNKDYKPEYHGGDGKELSFKIRSSKLTKILRNLDVEDTGSVNPVDISKKPFKEQQNIYLNTVLPTLQPSYSVVPFIISGVVITMTAFTWPDIMEICKIEEKIYDTLDPSDDDYIYQKNLIFLEKRRKQLDLFYNHIFSVSGFETKPSKDDLFGKILKFPDIQQLFFAAYAASFQKPYDFTIVCANCGTEQDISVTSKELCFLLNKNINIDRLNHYIEHGSVMNPKETEELYGEFQKEKIVEVANTTYRTSKKLPVSSFIYELKVPTIYEALETLDEIVEVFKFKPLEITGEDGSTVAVDSSMGLTKDLIELRSYLYFKSLIVAQLVNEDKANNSAKVGFVSFSEKNSIISSIYNLSSEDYKQLMSDNAIYRLVNLSGIRHAIKAGKCNEPTCGSDMGIIPIEPESLFFTIAQRELVN